MPTSCSRRCASSSAGTSRRSCRRSRCNEWRRLMAGAVDSAAWRALGAHHEDIRDVHLRELFDRDPERGTAFTATAEDLFVDYSKHRVDAETMALLLDLAAAA